MSLQGTLNTLGIAEVLEFLANREATGQLDISTETGTAVYLFSDGDVAECEYSFTREAGADSAEATYYVMSELDGTFFFDEEVEPVDVDADSTEEVAAVLARTAEVADKWMQVEASIASPNHLLVRNNTLDSSVTIQPEWWNALEVIADGKTSMQVASAIQINLLSTSMLLLEMTEAGLLRVEEIDPLSLEVPKVDVPEPEANIVDEPVAEPAPAPAVEAPVAPAPEPAPAPVAEEASLFAAEPVAPVEAATPAAPVAESLMAEAPPVPAPAPAPVVEAPPVGFSSAAQESAFAEVPDPIAAPPAPAAPAFEAPAAPAFEAPAAPAFEPAPAPVAQAPVAPPVERAPAPAQFEPAFEAPAAAPDPVPAAHAAPAPQPVPAQPAVAETFPAPDAANPDDGWASNHSPSYDGGQSQPAPAVADMAQPSPTSPTAVAGEVVSDLEAMSGQLDEPGAANWELDKTFVADEDAAAQPAGDENPFGAIGGLLEGEESDEDRGNVLKFLRRD